MKRLGKTVSFGCALSFALSAFGTMAPLSAGRRAEAVCDTVCFDFSRLTLMNQYHVGDSIRAGDATVYLESYLKNGNLISLAAATAYANQSLHSKGVPPELRTYFITNRVVPDFPLQSVTFRFGHINAPNGPDPHSNIGMNGDLREVVGSIAGMSGQIIGDPATGEAEVIVTLDAVQPANTIVGTVELRAVSGQIEEFTFGGVQFFVDDLCMKK